MSKIECRFVRGGEFSFDAGLQSLKQARCCRDQPGVCHSFCDPRIILAFFYGLVLVDIKHLADAGLVRASVDHAGVESVFFVSLRPRAGRVGWFHFLSWFSVGGGGD